jgi:hypothetical protein
LDKVAGIRGIFVNHLSGLAVVVLTKKSLLSAASVMCVSLERWATANIFVMLIDQ